MSFLAHKQTARNTPKQSRWGWGLWREPKRVQSWQLCVQCEWLYTVSQKTS